MGERDIGILWLKNRSVLVLVPRYARIISRSGLGRVEIDFYKKRNFYISVLQHFLSVQKSYVSIPMHFLFGGLEVCKA